MIPLATEEALLDKPKDNLQNSYNRGCVGRACPGTGGHRNSRQRVGGGVELNSGKEDNEGVNKIIEEQLVNLPLQQVKIQHQDQEGQTPIKVEESAPERDHEKEAISIK